MKKILALVSFLLVAAACGTPPSTNTTPASNANNATSMKSTAPPSEAEATAREKATWETLKKKDYDAFGNMLTSDYLEIGGDGIWDKAGIIAYVKDLNITDSTFSDWKVVTVDNDAVIVTYTVSLKGTFKGQPVPSGQQRSASVWVNREGKWLDIFYQSTQEKTGPPAAPMPAASQPAKGAASPAAKPGELGSDPIANEKLVWDAFRSRNYDAFAAMLAPDFNEIEPDGFYDKAKAVQMVTMFDASKFELSNWKSLKIDSDAAIVSYTIKGPGPNGDLERHSSIWASRGGKWMALLHVGTPVAKPATKTAEKTPAKPEMKKM